MKRNDKALQVLLLATCILSVEARAQTERALYKEKGMFLSMPANLRSDPALNSGFTAAQIKTLNNNMSAFMELVHKTPCINPPRGFEVGVYGGICLDGSCSGGKVLSGSAGLIIREYTTTAGNPVPERAVEGPGINVLFNDIRSMLKQGWWDKDGFAEPLIVNTIAGCPVLEGGFVVITKIKKPLYKYVTNEEVLKSSIKFEEDGMKSAKDAFGRGSGYQQWLKDKPGILKSIKEGLDILAKTEPATAKQRWEQTLAQYANMEADLKKGEAEQLKNNNEMLLSFEKRIKEMKDKLSAMNPEERKAPAQNGNGKKLVVPNPDFFDPARRATDLQLVIIDLYRYDLQNDNFPHQLIKDIRETLDIAALAASIK